MRTIEEIRLENFGRLCKELQDELGEELTDLEVSRHLGISKVYAWQLRTGARDKIDSKTARKFEAKANKPEGWMDTDSRLWPFPGIDPGRFSALSHDQKIEIQGLVRERVERFEDDALHLRKNGSTGK